MSATTGLLRPSVLALALLGGCTVAPDKFGDAYGHALCKLQLACAEGSFNASFPNLQACYDAQAVAWAGSEAALAGCAYDRKQAADCIDAIDKSTKSCDPADAASADAICGSVYLCSGGGDTAR